MLTVNPPHFTTTRTWSEDSRYEARGEHALFRDGVYRRVWRAYYQGAQIGELQGTLSLLALEADIAQYARERAALDIERRTQWIAQ